MNGETMTLKQLDIDNDIDLDDSDIGRFYMFWNPDHPEGQMYSFSSTLENIGVLGKHDRWMKNKTKVLVLSDPVEAHHPTMGPILVSRVMADEAMWVGTYTLHLINDK